MVCLKGIEVLLLLFHKFENAVKSGFDILIFSLLGIGFPLNPLGNKRKNHPKLLDKVIVEEAIEDGVGDGGGDTNHVADKES